MTYKEFIDNILETRGRFGCEGYKERHHIIPKCMGGTNDETNLIDLYAREHFDAHKMLAEIYEKEGGIRKAIDEYVKVVDLDGEAYDSYYKIAMLLKELGNKDDSRDMLTKLVNKKFQILIKNFEKGIDKNLNVSYNTFQKMNFSFSVTKWKVFLIKTY